MIVTSNRSPKDWYPLFPNPVLAESALDRLVNSAHHVTLRGRTYRPLRRPDGGGYLTSDEAEDPKPGQLGRTLQTRGAEKPQEPRNDVEVTPDTSAADLDSRSHRRSREPLLS